jgi:hypothetical protein
MDWNRSEYRERWVARSLFKCTDEYYPDEKIGEIERTSAGAGLFSMM